MMSSRPNQPPSYTAVIRWRGPDPAIELETRHEGFLVPEEAALFANAIAPTSPLALRLSPDADPALLLCDGQDVPFYATGITVWTLVPSDTEEGELRVATDSDFEAHRLLGFRLPAAAYGEYEQAQYAVLDASGTRVDVVVDWDDADHLRVTVEEETAADESQPGLLLGALPEA